MTTSDLPVRRHRLRVIAASRHPQKLPPAAFCQAHKDGSFKERAFAELENRLKKSYIGEGTLVLHSLFRPLHTPFRIPRADVQLLSTFAIWSPNSEKYGRKSVDRIGTRLNELIGGLPFVSTAGFRINLGLAFKSVSGIFHSRAQKIL